MFCGCVPDPVHESTLQSLARGTSAVRCWFVYTVAILAQALCALLRRHAVACCCCCHYGWLLVASGERE